MKTLFITISRVLVVRNLLRNKAFFSMLSEANDLRVIILFQNIKNAKPPAYIKEEFQRGNVIIEYVPNNPPDRVRKFYNKLVRKLVFTKSTKIFLRYHFNEDRRVRGIAYYILCSFYLAFSRSSILKKFVRRAGLLFKTDPLLKEYFDKYRPDLVFSTSIVSEFDIQIMQEARKRKIKAISMPKSWDNLDKTLFSVEPDLFLVQNEEMKRVTEKYQAIDSSKIKVVGFPQFDIYARPEALLTKEEYCKTKNFNPTFPVLFLGSEGIWSAGDDKIFLSIIKAREAGLIPKCNILVRPHIASIVPAYSKEYLVFDNYKNVFVERFDTPEFFEGADLKLREMADFVNSLYHCNIMITFASTLVLDAASFGKPLISVSYGVRFENKRDISYLMYETGHYKPLVDTGGIEIANSEKELMEKINFALANPELKSAERRRIKEWFCGPLDGRSGSRIADSILSML